MAIKKKKFKLPISEMVGVPSEIELNIMEDDKENEGGLMIKYCECERMKDVLSSGDGLTIYPEGNVEMSNNYIEIEFIYCPFCGKKINTKAIREQFYS